MVLASLGHHEPLEVVRQACGASRDGINAADLIQAGARFGVDAQGYCKEIDELPALGFPQILFWAFNHFVVLEAIRGDRFFINDPASGRRTVRRAEFGRCFTGVTLLFTPGQTFERNKRPAGMLRGLAAQLTGSIGAFATMLATSALLAILGVLVPGFTRVFIDDYLVRHFGNWLMPLLIGMGLVALLRTGLTWLNAEGLLLLRTKITAALSARFVWRLLHLPYAFFAQRSPNEVANRVQLSGSVANAVAGPFATLSANVVTMIFYALVMLTYDVLLTTVVLVLASLNLLVLYWVGRRVEENSQRLQMATANAHTAAIQAAALLEEHRATGTESVLFERMMNVQVALLNAEQQAGRTEKILSALPLVGTQLMGLGVLGVGAIQVIESDMTLGMLVAFQMLAELFSAPVSTIVSLGTAIRGSGSSLSRMADVMDNPAVDSAGSSVFRLAGHLQTEDLSVGYGSSASVLKDVSLSIRAGEMVGVCGGAGKTTLARALCGLVAPTKGRLLIDGTPFDQIEPASFGATIGYVDQTPFLSAGRLRDALTLWDDGVTTEELKAALDDACMLDIVMARPGGTEGRIGEGGAGFSGGERQRLALSRALAHHPAILVLDDATSALDEKTETAVLANLRRRGVTTILVTNRASALRQMDRLLVLEDGRLSAPQPLARPIPTPLRQEAA